MPTPPSADVLAALREFVARLDELDPEAPLVGELTLGLAGATERLPLRAPVARALTEALRGYHDPRDRGRCAHCAGPLDDDFVCRSCGIVNGLFGRTVAAFATPAEGEEEARGIAGVDRPDGTLND
ncbi:hypothetical protein GCM10020358_47510 [Amorphoplanes nipponensis]|uniref:Uncharacterized protein n=1 Tax=Actinoplanes nipponensis TaxID=135950 RepID=A0A919JHG8_9ACTN|nr:hypothetical protein [Actinoplanes nipponensis]GIE49450.1 hypothetical protein Ani05nite_29840 [Actinoplanes nipponensis]